MLVLTMTRLVFEYGEQNKFLREVKDSLDISCDMLGSMIGICGKSYRDWMNEKLLGKREALEKLSNMSGISLPTIVEEREDWWSGRVNGSQGGNARYKKYGDTFTSEDRIRGGHNSQVARMLYPEYYKKLGCNVAADFITPAYSEKLAEFIGIVLGDGGLTPGQCEISLHMMDDREYAEHVRRLINELFGDCASTCSYPRHNVIRVAVNGKQFINILASFGLMSGNKVRHQVDIPDWIKVNPGYLKACMRGLYDTDGTAFTHKHVVAGHRYVHFGVGFCSASSPLLNSFAEGMRQFGLEPHFNSKNIFCYGAQHSKQFFKIFAPHNPKYERRLVNYLSSGGSCIGKVK